ncbi:DUF7261 family protein [Natranaeroarchaeum sulfidigenes]|uniref:Putative pilin/flagellin n=1 Tax=Natranaeroarchaeum sulfidigenes TaxID=2784880 RepID=A0A897MWE5_9EURY|nr:hypothetical protein [Natranaeroarchaeum sulfidigenes]QSG03239.1 putative pilin/flagellin [Natranaeroarchaeum sulfidigenes]
MTEHTDNRGQLILAGAVVFSLVLIGIVVVFSTTLFTANMASSSANAGVSDAGALESDVEQTIHEYADRVNDDEEYEEYDVDGFADDIEDEYPELLAERYAESGPTIVDIVDVNVETGSEGEEIESVTVDLVYETRSTTVDREIELEDLNE